jgi:hypothetical protein
MKRVRVFDRAIAYQAFAHIEPNRTQEFPPLTMVVQLSRLFARILLDRVDRSDAEAT